MDLIDVLETGRVTHAIVNGGPIEEFISYTDEGDDHDVSLDLEHRTYTNIQIKDSVVWKESQGDKGQSWRIHLHGHVSDVIQLIRISYF